MDRPRRVSVTSRPTVGAPASANWKRQPPEIADADLPYHVAALRITACEVTHFWPHAVARRAAAWSGACAKRRRLRGVGMQPDGVFLAERAPR